MSRDWERLFWVRILIQSLGDTARDCAGYGGAIVPKMTPSEARKALGKIAAAERSLDRLRVRIKKHTHKEAAPSRRRR